MKSHFHVLVSDIDFPEGPYFDKNNVLWCVEKEGGNLVKYTDDETIRYPTGGSPNGLVVDADNNLLFCDSHQNTIRLFNQTTEQFSSLLTHINNQPFDAPNDLIFDSSGNLLFTCPGLWDKEKLGRVYCYSPKTEKVSLLKEELQFPNGLAVTHNSKDLIVAETRTHLLWKGKWDAKNCQWIDPKPWIDVGGPVGPDGMVFSKNNLLYVAVFGSSLVKIINVDGVIVSEIEVPGKNLTNVALDPQMKLGLIVTETEKGQLLSFPDIKDVGIDYDGSL